MDRSYIKCSCHKKAKRVGGKFEGDEYAYGIDYVDGFMSVCLSEYQVVSVKYV